MTATLLPLKSNGSQAALAVEPAASAKAAGLRYVTDAMPGIQRSRAGQEFVYSGPHGEPITDPDTLRRIQSLGIPPAWTDVWICPLSHGHLQATGRDVKDRKQYRYHPRWRELRDQTKYDRMIAFGEALPLIRARVAADLALPGMPREKVLATVMRLLEKTFIRVGNEEYARQNHSFGLTTLRNRHVEVAGSTLRFRFRGKSGKKHAVELHDRRVARVVQRCREIPGHHLFEYLDEEGECHTVGSGDVNDYLREITGQEFTAKEFRTWAGTLLAVDALRQLGAGDSETQTRKNIVQAIDAVTERLGNTRAVCRKYYIHPAVVAAYTEGSLLTRCAVPETTAPGDGLSAEEASVLDFLRERLPAHVPDRAAGKPDPRHSARVPRNGSASSQPA